MPESSTDDSRVKSPVDLVWELVRRERDTIGVAFLFAVVSGLMSLAAPVGVQILVNTLAFGAMAQPLTVLSALVLIALGLSGVARAMQISLVERLQERIFARAVVDAAENLVGATEERLATAGGQLLAHKFFDVVTVQKGIAVWVMEGAVLILQIALGAILLAVYHPLLLALSVVLFLATASVFVILGRNGVDTAIKESKEKYKTGAWLASVIGSQAMRDSGSLLSDAEGHIERYLGARRKHFTVVFRQSVGFIVIQALATSALLTVGGLLVLSGDITLGQLVASELVVTATVVGLAKLGKHLESYYDLVAAAGKLGELTEPSNPTGTPSIWNRMHVPKPARIATRIVGLAAAITAFILVLTPWRQSTAGKGRVVAYAPIERQQTIEAPIEGRVSKWYVVEGSQVRKGDALVDIVDNDPDILLRLRGERDAVKARIEAAEARTDAADARVVALKSSRISGVSAAESRIRMAEQRRAASDTAYHASEASAKAALLNHDRQKALFEQGLTSKRSVELAEADEVRTRTEVDRARANQEGARSEISALLSDQGKIGNDANASISDAMASRAVAEAEIAAANVELQRIEVRLARQTTQEVKASADGTILHIQARVGVEMVKSGDALATFVPDANERAAEIWVAGNDVNLIRRGATTRLQFEGWPAFQFSGWPSLAVGTFPARVSFVDSATTDEKGRFRVVVVPEREDQWPSVEYLRQGTRVSGWVILGKVKLGYELWRQFNGFPPEWIASTESKSSEKPVKK
jgi:membrane fusion protein, adhesin transport system